MTDAFETVFGQPQVRQFFRSAFTQGRVSHAYLLVGPIGAGKALAATAFSQAMLCEESACGCGKCDDCRRIARKSHPDVQFYGPEGTSGYLVSQIRSIVADASRAPVRARRKVYVIERADLLGTQAANAFLKTLEEPPANVTLILTARSADGVLPTIASRCQIIPFRTIAQAELVGLVQQNGGVTEQSARIALQAGGGSLVKAVEFLKSPERKRYRQRTFEVMALLRESDSWGLMGYAKELALLAKAPLDAVRIQQERELEENADFLSKAAVRRIEESNKRALGAQGMELLHQLCRFVRSWLRDVLALCMETPDLVVNQDVLPELELAAQHTDEARLAHALHLVDEADRAFTYNVSPETGIDALLIELRQAIYSSPQAQRASSARLK